MLPFIRCIFRYDNYHEVEVFGEKEEKEKEKEKGKEKKKKRERK